MPSLFMLPIVHQAPFKIAGIKNLFAALCPNSKLEFLRFGLFIQFCKIVRVKTVRVFCFLSASGKLK